MRKGEEGADQELEFEIHGPDGCLQDAKLGAG